MPRPFTQTPNPQSSQAQYNTPIGGAAGSANVWPPVKTIFKQVASPVKEMFVDTVGVPENKDITAEEATRINFVSEGGGGMVPPPLTATSQPNLQKSHTITYSEQGVKENGDGVPLAVIQSFVRRHLVGTGEAPMPRPSIALEWEVC